MGITLTEPQTKDMLEAAKPLIKWLAENFHPHCSAVVEADSVRLVESICKRTTKEFIKP